MNTELINKIAHECHHTFSEHHIDLERFAELIIRKCADLADAPSARVPSIAIKKYFGLEEGGAR